MSIVKDHTDLDDGIDVEYESNTPVEHRKHTFCQTSINDQRPKLRVHINGTFEGFLDTGVDVSIIIPESWHLNWLLQEIDV